MAEKEVDRVRFGLKQDEDYRLIPINGVRGGAPPRGDIGADFLYEPYTVPTEVTHRVTPHGQVREELERNVPQQLQRTVFACMMLTVEQADSIGRWLQEKAREMHTLREDSMGTLEESSSVTTHWNAIEFVR